jgi:heat shock protein HslJ
MIIMVTAMLTVMAYRHQKQTGTQPAYTRSNIPVGCTLPDSNRLEGKWFLLPVLASDTVTGRVPYIIFDTKAGRFSGHTGCNTMSGRVTVVDRILHFDSNMVTTKMICTGYNERAFIKSLLRTDGYKFDHGALVLLEQGIELSRWTRRLMSPPKERRA